MMKDLKEKLGDMLAIIKHGEDHKTDYPTMETLRLLHYYRQMHDITGLEIYKEKIHDLNKRLISYQRKGRSEATDVLKFQGQEGGVFRDDEVVIESD